MAKTRKIKSDPEQTPRDWFRIERPKAEASPSTDSTTSADVYIYDVIGGWFGIEAIDFVQAIAGLDVQTINLYVNSPGGDVFDGTAITNALRRHPANVIATVDGIAASAASFILTAANEVVMGQGSSLMIHDAWSMAMGNAQDMRDTADLLDKLSDNIAGMYAAKAGGTQDGWRQVMRDELWLNADEAVEMGLADRVDETADTASNVFDLKVYAHAGRADAPAPAIATLRAVALSTHPAASRPRGENPNLTPAPAAVTTPEPPAQPKMEEPAMVTDTTEAPVEPQTAAAPAFDMEAFAAAMAAITKSQVNDALAPFLAQAPTAGSPGVPASLAFAKKKELGFRDAMNMFTARSKGTLSKEGKEAIEATLTDGAQVFDALTNISLADATAGGLINTNPAQWLGELVTKVPYDGLWDFINKDDLTSPNVQAFVIQTEPTGGTKADGGGAVTSTGAKWVLDTFNVARWAGADSFDRTPFDFGIQASALSSYFRIQLRNYYIWRDAKLITAMSTGVTQTYNPPAPANSVITQVTNQILEGVAAVLNQGGGLANIATMPVALYKTLLKASQVQAPAFITLDLGALSQGDVEGKIVVRPDLSATVATGNVLVANGAGVTGYELPESPVRAEQMQVTIGNIDVGLFGYCLALLDSPNYAVLVGQGS
jgi:ATP-dependent protease ClpP protease subunit